MSSPNVLLIMTDEERYPPPVRDRRGRRSSAAPSSRLGSGSATAESSCTATTRAPRRACRAGPRCSPGQYPSLHGVSQTDGVAKHPDDPAMRWLDPDEVPTLGDWFRAGGYQTHYRGKWHISHADLADARHPRGPDGVRRRRPPDPRGRRGVPQGRPARPVRLLRAGSAASPTAPRSPTAAPCATASSPSRSPTCSATWPALAATGRGSRSPRS